MLFLLSYRGAVPRPRLELGTSRSSGRHATAYTFLAGAAAQIFTGGSDPSALVGSIGKMHKRRRIPAVTYHLVSRGGSFSRPDGFTAWLWT